MSSQESIKRTVDEGNVWNIVALCEKYISLLPSKEQWERMFDGELTLFTLEKMMSVINHRFYQEFIKIQPWEGLDELMKKPTFLFLNSGYNDYCYEDAKGNSYGIIDMGEDLMYFYEYPHEGLSLPDKNDLFSFYEEEICMLHQYCIDEGIISENDAADEKKLLDTFFPGILQKDETFPTFAYNLIADMQDALFEEVDTIFILHSCDGLHKCLTWMEEDAERKELPETKKLLHFFKEYKTPMLNGYTYNTPYYFVQTEVNTYMCYVYGFAQYMNFMTDGKFYYPSHFFTMVAMEFLLQLIEEKYY